MIRLRRQLAAAAVAATALAGCAAPPASDPPISELPAPAQLESTPPASTPPTSGPPVSGAPVSAPPAPQGVAVAPATAVEANRWLQPGVNLGNMLEAPAEGEWGLTVKTSYLDMIRDAGFRSVRIPISWSYHASQQAPFTIDPVFFRRVDDVIGQALARGLAVVIDDHYVEDLVQNPQGQRARFLAIWRQIAERYRNHDARLMFEVMNEPHNMDAALWNDLFAEATATIRQSNPTRMLIVGPVDYSSPYRLADLRLPPDPHLIVTIHYYSPYHFTHQGTAWVDGSTQWIGTTWTGDDAQHQEVVKEIDMAVTWAAAQHLPLFIGEFGAYKQADEPSRQRWTGFVARTAEARSASWAYWDFGAGFGVYDPAAGTWDTGLLEQLIPR